MYPFESVFLTNKNFYFFLFNAFKTGNYGLFIIHLLFIPYISVELVDKLTKINKKQTFIGFNLAEDPAYYICLIHFLNE